jgi:Zn-dependent protease with chaperone function
MGLSQALWNSRYWLAGLHALFLIALSLVFFVIVIACYSSDLHEPDIFQRIIHTAISYAYMPVVCLCILWIAAILLANQPPLELTRSDPADAIGQQKLQNRLDALCIARNLPATRLYVVNYPSLNALIWGRNVLRLYVTQQACEQLTAEELDALMAQQLGHLHNGDNHIFPLMSLFIMMGCQMALLLLGGVCLLFADSLKMMATSEMFIPLFVLAMSFGLLWLAFRYYGSWYGNERRFAADLFGIQLCQNAWALIRVIERCKDHARLPILPEDWRTLAFLDTDPSFTLPWYVDPEDRIVGLRNTLGISTFGER